jgi:predicted peroxiredoxin/TusA-related sulfurtransferase
MPTRINPKQVLFTPSHPAQVDGRQTLKSYICVYEILKELRHRDNEAVVELVMKNDKGMLHDIATWCEATGNELLSSEPGEKGEVRCLVQKGELKRREKKKSMTVVISTASLEKVVFPFDKALGAAVLGMDVNVIFEGAGVRLLKRGYRSKLSGFWGGCFTGAVENVMKTEIGWPLPGDAIEILEELGAKFYVCGPSLVGYGVREEELVVREFMTGATLTWVKLLAESDINVFSKAEFEKP